MVWVGDLTQDLIAFVARELSVSPERIRLSTRLGKDLGVDGDDGLEVMARFAETFGVDLSALKPEAYFGPEGINPLWLLSPSWWRRKYKEITIQDLLDAARAGVWVNR
jgi:hypothetical protein